MLGAEESHNELLEESDELPGKSTMRGSCFPNGVILSSSTIIARGYSTNREAKEVEDRSGKSTTRGYSATGEAKEVEDRSGNSTSIVTW